MNNIKDAGLNQVSSWSVEFESRRKEIIELWDACKVPLVHRTCFYLLFKGDPSDSVYMEVELRRLSFLKSGSVSKESLNARCVLGKANFKPIKHNRYIENATYIT